MHKIQSNNDGSNGMSSVVWKAHKLNGQLLTLVDHVCEITRRRRHLYYYYLYICTCIYHCEMLRTFIDDDDDDVNKYNEEIDWNKCVPSIQHTRLLPFKRD